MVWKSKGDGEKRKYDFAYDAANRLLRADFKQYTNGSFNQSAGVNYDVKMGNGISPETAYDYNGNIKQMQQWGLKVFGSQQIDNLQYQYLSQGKSNKLARVTDGITGNNNLSDFTDGSNADADDYNYDVNGNMVSDLNKNISSIIYNHLNLPQQINVTGKGTISYVYDAGGNKLQKITNESGASVVYAGSTYVGVSITTTTNYIAGVIYESKTYSNATLQNALGYTDKLQFMNFEEGRIRPIYATSQGTLSGLSIDYMLKDHLGNVRMLLTDEVLTTPYPAATMEPATIGDESKIYSNLTSTQTDKPSWFNDPLYSTSTKVARLKNAAGSAKVGPSIILKVMAGDTYNIRVTSGWNSPNSPYNYNSGVITDLLNQLVNGLPSVSGGKATSSDLQNSGTGLNGSLSSYINQLPYSTTTPKAYLNWVLLDEQFKIAKNEYGTIIASGYSGFDAVDANGVMKTHVLSNLPVAKSGYLVIYTSNEASNIDVYFDNLQVTHTRGPILEETQYYPFGLSMAGISSRAANTLENKRKWNKGSELQNKEFSDGSGLELYATPLRSLDPQLGRWWQIDSKPDYSQSLYSSMGNNPIKYNDPLGDTLRISFRTGFLGLGKRQEVVYDKGNLTNKDGSAYTGKVKGYLGKVVDAIESLTYNSKEGNSMVRELEESKNNFSIKNGSSNSFSPSNQTASFVNIPSLQNVSNGILPTGGSGGTIVWNPGISTSGMNTAGNTDRPAFIGLGHEMAHARDANQGNLYIGSDYTNPLNGNSYLARHLGLNKSEWRAVYFENIIRGHAGIPLRSQYGLQDNGGSFTGTGPALLTLAGLPINFPIQ